jgi:CBS domain-containing protein
VVRLVVSGQLKQLKFGTEGFTADFREAVEAPIRTSVKELLPIQSVQADEKADDSQLQKMIDKKDEALLFVLGKKYVQSYAKKYLTRLTQLPFFRFVELQQNGGALFGLVDARLLFDHLKTETDWDNFVGAIFETKTSDLSALPGFVSATSAVSSEASKSYVLEKMEEWHLDWLPVVDAEGKGKFVGIVERSAILARLVLDLDKQLRQ